jgi:hypothetical protein
VAAVTAIVAFNNGYQRFKETQQGMQESQAMDLYVKYTEINRNYER